MIRIFIEDNEIDISPISIAQTFQINDLADLKDRQLSFTQRFKVPGTPKNRTIFQQLGRPGSKSRKPYQRIKARLEVNGVELISEGYAKINQSLNEEYDIHIYSGNSSIYEILKDRKINELNYSGIDHILTEEVHLGSMEAGSPFIYAFGKFGVTSLTGVLDVTEMAPAIYKWWLFKRIIEEAGFTFEGDIFSDENFLNEVVMPTKGYDTLPGIETETDKGSANSDLIDQSISTNKFREKTFPFSFNDVSLVDVSLANGGEDIVIGFDGIMKIAIDLDYTITSGDISLQILHNGEEIDLPEIDPSSNQRTFYLQVLSGDIINFNAIARTEDDGSDWVYDFEGQFTSIDFSLVTGGQLITFQPIMPDSNQTDFIIDCMQRYGMIFATEKDRHHLRFMTIEDLLNDRANAEDWSDKVMRSYGESYNIGSYAQNNLMKFTYEDSEVRDTDLDGNLQTNHKNLPDEKTLFTSKFTASNQVSTRNTIPVYGVPIWEMEDDNGVEVRKNVETKWRSFTIERFDEAVNYQIGDLGSSWASVTDTPFLSLTNHDYTFLIENYYPAFRRLLDNQKKLTILADLRLNDIYHLDFLRLKYLSQFGQYYYLNKIINWIDSKYAKVELIQAAGITQNLPPSQLGLIEKDMNHGEAKTIVLNDILNASPPYADPEFDPPEKIRFISGFDSEILIKNNGATIIDNTPIDIATMNLIVEDQGNNPSEHTATLIYEIMDEGSGEWSSVTGSVYVLVREELNLPPVADAGPNTGLTYYSNGDQSGIAYLFGNGSYDPNGDSLTYLWTTSPLPDGVVLSANDEADVTLVGSNLDQFDDGKIITCTLRVIDPSGLWDEDTMTVTLVDLSSGGTPPPDVEPPVQGTINSIIEI